MCYKGISSPEHPVAENDANRLIHTALPIGKSNVLMASDVLEIILCVTENDIGGTISISVESREEADKLFKRLSAGGKVEMSIVAYNG